MKPFVALATVDAVNILNTVTDAVMVMNTLGIVLYANPSAHQLLEREVLVGKNCGLPLTNTTESIEVQLVRAGGVGWAQLRTTPIQWADRSAILLTLTDISKLKTAQQRIAESEARFRAMFESIPFVAWMKDTNSRYTHVNKHWLQSADKDSNTSIIGKDDFEIWPDELAAHYKNIDMEVIETRQQKRLVEKAIINGAQAWTETFKSPVIDEHGHILGTIGLARDITEERGIEEKLRLAASIYESSSEGMIVTDAQNKIVAVNAAFTTITGYSTEDVIGKNPNILSSGAHDKQFFTGMWHAINTQGYWHGEIYDRKKNGELQIKRMTINVIPDNVGETYRYVALFSDVTDIKKNEATIWHQANYDLLTELPNRRLFLDRLDQEILKAERSGTFIAIFFIDLDRFKEINDTLGHQAGDILLMKAAKRIADCVRSYDTVSRFGGDEFMIILADLEDLSHVDAIAQQILLSLQAPLSIENELFFTSGSIGITLYPNDAKTSEELVKNADQAMYASKTAGRNRFSYFTNAMQDSAQARLKLTSDLRNAIETNQFRLFYQPIVELATGKIYKAEALIRWFHPVNGIVSPAAFIPLAEETGLIIEMGDAVFKEAANFAKYLSEKTGQLFQISVNKSPVQFHNKLKSSDWIMYLNEIGLHPRQIVVEITEGLLLDSDPGVINHLLEFRDAGIEVAIDDFGTGYSSLAYLNKFDIDYLKIDQSFTKNIQPGSSDLAISEAIIMVAHKLGLKVIAEGVETTAQRDLLFAAGCDFAQGYLYSKPVCAEEFEKLLQRTDLSFAVNQADNIWA